MLSSSCSDWNSVPPPERRKLTAEAERRSVQTDKSDAVLQALYFLTQKVDEWESLRALALIVRRPDLDFDRKTKGLEHIWQTLEGFRTKLTQHDNTAVRRYKLYEADYYALSADVRQQGDSGTPLSQVIQLYQSAQQIWQQYGVTERVEWAREQIETLQDMAQRGESLLPIELLRSERAALQTQIQDLKSQIETAQAALLETQQSERAAAAKAAKIEEETKAAEQQTQQLQDRLQLGEQALRDLREKVEEHEVGLQFLMALPRAATAPLWVEVVELALDQGEYDPLVRQALERLAEPYPEQALPLLAEIAARAPEPFAVPSGTFQDATVAWLSAIAEARVLMEQDVEAAAQRLVDAWSAFFEDTTEAAQDE